MNEKYAKAYTEVLEIINHFSREEYSKIPNEKIKFYENNRDKNYHYEINSQVNIEQQDISKEAESILVSLFRDYFATEKQKNVLENLLKQNLEKAEKEKWEKYSYNSLFKNNKVKDDNKEKQLFALVKVKNQKWYEKIFDFFKNILKNN